MRSRNEEKIREELKKLMSDVREYAESDDLTDPSRIFPLISRLLQVDRQLELLQEKKEGLGEG